jgi:hypothetical protein
LDDVLSLFSGKSRDKHIEVQLKFFDLNNGQVLDISTETKSYFFLLTCTAISAFICCRRIHNVSPLTNPKNMKK